MGSQVNRFRWYGCQKKGLSKLHHSYNWTDTKSLLFGPIIFAKDLPRGCPEAHYKKTPKNQKNPKKYFETFGSTLGSIGPLIGAIENKQVDFTSFFPQKLKKTVFYRSSHVGDFLDISNCMNCSILKFLSNGGHIVLIGQLGSFKTVI